MAKISPDKIEQVRIASDIVDVVSGYLTLRNRGRNYFGLCPFHKEKTPSFSVNPDLQIFHCFGCGAGGNVFTFIMRMEGVTFPESVKLLAQKAGIVLPEEEENVDEYREKEALFYANNLAAQFFQEMIQTDQAADARRYLASRDIPEAEYDLFGIGYAPNAWDGLIQHATAKSLKTEVLHKAGLVIKKDTGNFYDRFRGRITFAIKNLSGQVVGFGARRIVNDNSPKYINSPETEVYQKRFILYGLYTSRDEIRRADSVVIVEGYTDLTSLYRVNIRNVVATSGTALTEDHARLLRRYTSNATLLYDSDSAGAAAALRGADILLENGLEVQICTMPENADPDEFARQHGEQEVRRLLSSAVPLLEFKLNRFEYESRYGSSSQKATLTREVLGSVIKVNDPIRRSFLVRDLAERLRLEESYLWSEVNKLQRQTRFRSRDSESERSPTDNAFFNTSKGTAELGLLGVALRHPEVIERILKNINLDQITHAEIQMLFERFSNQPVDPLTFQVQDYLTLIEDATIATRLSNLMVMDDPFSKPWSFARECIIRLHQSLVEEQIAQLKKEMQTKPENSAALMDELKYLSQEREKIKRGEYIIE